jgi:hypothetical protein
MVGNGNDCNVARVVIAGGILNLPGRSSGLHHITVSGILSKQASLNNLLYRYVSIWKYIDGDCRRIAKEDSL